MTEPHDSTKLYIESARKDDMAVYRSLFSAKWVEDFLKYALYAVGLGAITFLVNVLLNAIHTKI